MRLHPDLWEKFQMYLLVDRKMSNSKASVYAIKSRFHKLIRWFKDKDFTRDNVNVFIGEMQRASAAKSYMNKMIALCKHLDKFLNINNLQDYTYYKETYQPKEILTPVEIEAIANITMPYKKDCAYVNLRQRALVLLLGTTGSRIGEALSLKWSDILSTPPHIVYRETKNGEARAIPIGQTVYDLIMSLSRKSDYVFSTYRAGPLAQQQVNLDFQWRAHTIGVKKPVYNHIFRHSYITTMLEQGVDVSDVAKIVGHKNLNSTMRYKNSLLGYYSEVIQLHPLLHSHIAISQIAKRLQTYTSKLIDTDVYKFLIEEDHNKLTLTINRLSSLYNPLMPKKISPPSYLESITNEILSKYRRLDSILEHAPTKGSYHERILRDAIRDYLPTSFSTGEGFIINKAGKVSTQLDILIVDNLDPRSYIHKDGNFFIATDIAAVSYGEVKTYCTKSEFIKSFISLVQTSQLICPPESKTTGFIFCYDAHASAKTFTTWADEALVHLAKKGSFEPWQLPDYIACFKKEALLELKQTPEGYYSYSHVIPKKKSSPIVKEMIISSVIRCISNGCGRLRKLQGIRSVEDWQ